MLSDHPGGAVRSTATLFPLVYDELKRIAHRRLHAEGGCPTLCTTELVHEAFLKLADPAAGEWQGRAHFFGAASRAMRQVFVDFARRRGAAKRGGGLRLVTLGSEEAALELELDDMLELDAALDRLDQANPRLCRIVELRFFGGVPQAEIARLFGVSERTVERDWLKARLFLLQALDRGEAPVGDPRRAV